MFDRQDSVRSEYTSDRESTRYGIVQQASIDSTDSRICYLTSSEVSSVWTEPYSVLKMDSYELAQQKLKSYQNSIYTNKNSVYYIYHIYIINIIFFIFQWFLLNSANRHFR